MSDIDELYRFARNVEEAVTRFCTEALGAIDKERAQTALLELLARLEAMHGATVAALRQPPLGELTRTFDVAEQGSVFIESLLSVVPFEATTNRPPAHKFDVDEQGSVFIESCIEVRRPAEDQGTTVTMEPASLVDRLLQIEGALLEFWRLARDLVTDEWLRRRWTAVVDERTNVVTHLRRLAGTVDPAEDVEEDEWTDVHVW